MKTRHLGFATSAVLCLSHGLTFAAEGIPPNPWLNLHRCASSLELSWPASFQPPEGGTIRPIFELQSSADLRRWEVVGQRMRAPLGEEQRPMVVRLPATAPLGFFRLLQVKPQSEPGLLGEGGAEVLGYGKTFESELQRIGQISPDQFGAIFSSDANYLPALSWDPRTAQFWAEFNRLPQDWFDRDLRLNGDELALFMKNGFVVSQRLRSATFASAFYTLWHADLPVFISCDSILQAWHRTYDGLLEEVEETYLFQSTETILDGMAAQVSGAFAQVGGGVLRDSLLDADYFLTVARSLLAGTNVSVSSPLGQDARVAATLDQVRTQELTIVPDFMGFCRTVDFSQFKIRGHYTHSERLGRYFQCLMWLGRIDIPIAGGPWERCPLDVRCASPRELGLALVLWDLLHASGQFQTWADMERTISVFIGPTDSLTFGQLDGLLAAAGIENLGDITSLAVLEQLQAELAQGELGLQNIRSDWFNQPLGGGATYALPRTFTVFGQKFVLDSWTFSQTVFSSIKWVENGITNKVPRRVPGALDVAFSMFANDQVVPELVAQMKGTFNDPDRPHALAFRDGYAYQHNLAAVRAVMDQQTPEAWQSNIYMQWLWCLRALSEPTTSDLYPEAMRTRAWAMKILNTQLASWTQLRHDTILYAKQSYTSGNVCSYPIAFIEPRLEFWKRLRQTATLAAEQIARLDYVGTYYYVDPDTGVSTNASLTAIQRRQVDHLLNFASRIQLLETLVTKELNRQPFTQEESTFLDSLMEGSTVPGGCGGYPTYSGWYPQLFYRAIHWSDVKFHLLYGAGGPDALIADVHTDVPCDACGDPGSVLHEAVGKVNLLMIAVDNGEDRFICAGPVLSHYEFEVLGSPRRLSDQEWGGDTHTTGILDGHFPPDVPASRIEGLQPPVWTESYLAR